MILRASTEIESISKDLYQQIGGTKDRNDIKYDFDAIKLIEQKWLLSKKIVIIANGNCHFSNLILKPFIKDEKRTGKSTLTFGWNNAYQNLKHDRSQSLKFASIKNLFNIMAALIMPLKIKTIFLKI